jgi:hypothetical protein
MDLQFWIGLVVGAVVSAALWLFRPDWLRQRAGLDPKPPYHLAGIRDDIMRADPVVGSSLPRSDQLSWLLESQVPLKLQQGYQLLLTPDGRRCVYVRKDYSGTETLVLLRKGP